jgi:hypothetical protein
MDQTVDDRDSLEADPRQDLRVRVGELQHRGHARGGLRGREGRRAGRDEGIELSRTPDQPAHSGGQQPEIQAKASVAL